MALCFESQTAPEQILGQFLTSDSGKYRASVTILLLMQPKNAQCVFKLEIRTVFLCFHAS